MAELKSTVPESLRDGVQIGFKMCCLTYGKEMLFPAILQYNGIIMK